MGDKINTPNLALIYEGVVSLGAVRMVCHQSPYYRFTALTQKRSEWPVKKVGGGNLYGTVEIEVRK